MSGSNTSLLDRISENKKLSVGLLALISITFFLFIGKTHLFDWDEINFAENAREMIESGDYMHVQVNFTPFWEKPPFFFWLQVLSMKLFGINEFAARFPNAVFGFIYLTTLYFIGKKHFSSKFGLIWALLFTATLLPHAYFKSGIIDPVFNYFIFLSIYFMILVIDRKEVSKKIVLFALLSGIFSAFSVLTKGPVGFLLLGLTLFVYLTWNRFKLFPPVKYILVFIVGFFSIVAIWLSIEVAQNGWDNMLKFVSYQLELFNQDVAGHAQPFFYHPVVLLFGCFPISILGMRYLGKSGLQTPYNFHKWMLVLFWAVLILFSIVKTKIIHYSSMTYLPLAFISTLFLIDYANDRVEFKKVFRILYLFVGSTLALALLALPLLIANKESLYALIRDKFTKLSLVSAEPWSGLESLIGIFLFFGIIYSYRLLIQKRIDQYILTMVITLVITINASFYFILPKVEDITQGPLISFIEEKSNEDCYIEIDYKSYAHYFYGKIDHEHSTKGRDKTDLLRGELDKTLYYIAKPDNNVETYFHDLVIDTTFSAYTVYKRLPNKNI